MSLSRPRPCRWQDQLGTGKSLTNDTVNQANTVTASRRRRRWAPSSSAMPLRGTTPPLASASGASGSRVRFATAIAASTAVASPCAGIRTLSRNRKEGAESDTQALDDISQTTAVFSPTQRLCSVINQSFRMPLTPTPTLTP